jgi:hypothetical protein
MAALRALRLDDEMGRPSAGLASRRRFASFTASTPAAAAVAMPRIFTTVLAFGMAAEATDGPEEMRG